MSRGEGGAGAYASWDFADNAELERRKKPKRASPARTTVVLYILLALAFVIFIALTIVNLRRVSAAWEELERARMRSEKTQAAAWHNLSDVHHALDKQLSRELNATNGRLAHALRELEDARSRCGAACGKELLDRLRALEERDALEPVLRQLEELKREQNRVSASLDAALAETRNLSEILCPRCPAGWEQFTRTCYFFSAVGKPWPAAKASCAELGAHLAIVDSEQENKFLANHVMDGRLFWLGLSDAQIEGDWRWVDGTSLALPFWSGGEPNNVGHHGEDCAAIYFNGRWNDVACSSPEAWICERAC